MSGLVFWVSGLVVDVLICFGVSGLVLYKLFLPAVSPLREIHFQNMDLFRTVLSVCLVSPLGESLFRILMLVEQFVLSAMSPLWGDSYSES